ncbi:LCI fold-containing protein [Bacillus sp. 22475]|uniref:LCI fold-containing protein n=1 Tax=Bacillus sp. 22475 TaxID=3453925 RepID=UPI003F875BBB
MFKKLVVGALAAGIAITGGIGSASAHGPTCNNPEKNIYYDDQHGKFYMTVFSSKNVFANVYKSGGKDFYFKGSSKTTDCGGGYYAHYEYKGKL